MKFKKLLFSAIAALSVTFNASAMDDGCNQAERDPNASIKRHTYVTPKDYDYQFDVWWLHCGSSEQLLFKTYLKPEIDSGTNGTVADYAKIEQNGKEIEELKLAMEDTDLTKSPQYRSVVYSNSQLNANKHIEVCVTGGYKSDYMCKTLFPNNKTGSSGAGLFTVTGSWYAPAYNGSGYNVVEAPNGLVVYFYGYKGGVDGQAQWLASDVGPATITKGQSMQLKMYSATVGNGGSFTTKPSVGSGISEWGTATITFNSCNSGTIVLDGNDGKITHNVVKLANIKHVSCSE